MLGHSTRLLLCNFGHQGMHNENILLACWGKAIYISFLRAIDRSRMNWPFFNANAFYDGLERQRDLSIHRCFVITSFLNFTKFWKLLCLPS